MLIAICVKDDIPFGIFFDHQYQKELDEACKELDEACKANPALM